MRKIMVLLFVALSAGAQETFFSESIDVRIINVDVIVTDRRGAPVPGLTKDDFELRENGQPKEITNFYEYRGLPSGPGVQPQTIESAPSSPTQVAPATADLRPRRIVIFIDDQSLQPSNRNRVFPAMKKFVRTALRPGDTVMIARWDKSLEFALEFTGDPKIAEAKLDELALRVNSGATRKMEFNTFKWEITPIPPDEPPIEVGVSGARLFAQRIVHEHHRKIEAMRSLISSMRGLDGRKVFVFLSETLSEEPGREAFDYLYLIRHKFANGKNFMPELVQEDYSDHSVVTRISEPANSAGVTLYPIDAGGSDSMFDRISSDASGAAMASTDGGTHEEAPEARVLALNRIAAATGGVATTLSNNFELAFTTITNDLNSYYSLGYRADSQRQDAVRSIEVRMKKKGYTVRTRNSFVEKSLTAEMSDAVAANLFYPVAKNELQIEMNAGERNRTGDEATVPITITIPTAGLTLVPDGDDLTGRFTTFSAFVRHDGVVSTIKSQTHQLRFPAASLSRRKEITLKLDVKVDNGTDGLSVGVMDDISRATGFATIRL